MAFVMSIRIQLVKASHMVNPDNGAGEVYSIHPEAGKGLWAQRNNNATYHSSIFSFFMVHKTMVCLTIAGILEAM